MSETEYAAWTEPAITNFATDVAQASGMPLDEALTHARAQFPMMLPNGLATPHAYLFVIVDSDGIDVGTLWLGRDRQRPTVGYVYDIVINADRRGEGLGRDAMRLAEDVLTAEGFESIALSVFGFNINARALYDSLGYQAVATTMAKPLPN